MRYIILALAFSMLVAGCHTKKTTRYLTWDGLEPDLWSAVWLLHRLYPDAEILVRPAGSSLQDGIPFGVKNSRLRRTQDHTIYESIMHESKSSDPVLAEIGRIIRDIEIRPWYPMYPEKSMLVEQSFRTMQERFINRNVPVACYIKFFESIYRAVEQGASADEWSRLDSIGDARDTCRTDSNYGPARIHPQRVITVEIGDLMNMIASGIHVIFVDAREPEEFDEMHIPGAINLQRRNLDKNIIEQLKNADLVVAYCIKDFRGYELARALAERGIHSAAVMKPYGLAGWRSLHLPVTNKTIPMNDAGTLLQECARNRKPCDTLI